MRRSVPRSAGRTRSTRCGDGATSAQRVSHERVDVGVARGAVVGELAVGEGEQATDAVDERQLVRRDDERRAACRRLVEHREQRLLAGDVEADERLVDEQQLERPDQRERDRRLLAQSAAERRRQLVEAVGQPDASASRSAARRPSPRRRAGGRRTRGARTATGRRRTSGCRTGRTARRAPPRCRRDDRRPRRSPRRRLEQTGDHPQQRRLAAAVVADERDVLTAWRPSSVSGASAGRSSGSAEYDLVSAVRAQRRGARTAS